MVKQIAVLMCALTFDNQKKLFSGMMEAAKEKDCNLYVFTNYISLSEKEESIQGAYHIFNLPDFREFDGAILVKNSMQYEPVEKSIVKALQQSKIPTVSIDFDILGIGHIDMCNYKAEMDMVEHFIIKHGCKDIYYVSGPISHLEGEERYKAYCDTMEKYGIKIDESYVYKGCFNKNSGREAVKKFLGSGKCPEAIICDNDYMAIGVMEALKEWGYRVPEDVKVAGFGNIELSQLHNPSLTTVDRKQKKAGYAAVCQVLSQIAGHPAERKQIPWRIEARRSCGCQWEEEADTERFKELYLSEKAMIQDIADTIRNMIADFSGMEKPEELIEAMKKHIIPVKMEAFYLCLCEKEKMFKPHKDSITEAWDINQVNTNYTKKICIPMAYEKGKYKSYESFPKGKVLPDQCKQENGGNYFIVAPIHYQTLCYGYCVAKNSKFPVENVLYYSWLMSIGIGLENIRKWMMLRDTVVKLEGVWAYDTLTHLYNRAGFFHYMTPLLKKMKEQDKEAFLLFMDIDGLKQVNDTLGHEIGDWMIREMAEVIKQNLKEGQIAMRYGGDEFVILGSVEEGQIENLPDELRDAMRKLNLQNDNLFELKASMGISRHQAKEIRNLDTLLDQADKKMYEEKRRRKAADEKVVHVDLYSSD